jgi:peptidyl-prolyl cis-trans isomerase SurA
MAPDTPLISLPGGPRCARWRRRAGALLLVLAGAAAGPAPAQLRSALPAQTEPGDHIVAIVNQELVTAVELAQRAEALRQAAVRAGQPSRPAGAWRSEALEDLISERVIVTHAREMGGRVDDVELDRAVQSVAAQNQMSMDRLREALRAQGMDMARFRADLRDQILVERVREREVIGRIDVSQEEIDRELAAREAQSRQRAELNLAQILVTVPEGADEATVATRRARAEQALARVRAGEPFDAVARELSEGDNRERGGELGLRPADRLPDLFVDAVAGLEPGQVRPALLRSGAGFHVLKLLERRAGADPGLSETRARHILLRVSPQASAEQAAARLLALRREIESGARSFEAAAREVSEDGSAAQGGDLGWFAPGMMVPEFEQPASRLPVGAISEPVRSRFGVHLIQVLERRPLVLSAEQKREQVRNVLRERKFAQAYEDWVAELRARAYVELRDAQGS